MLESDTGEFVLTTHKVRLEAREFGQASVKSIALEELTGSEIKYVSRPWLLILAAAAPAGGLFIGEGTALFLGIGVGAIAGIAYFVLRHQAIFLSSPSTEINLSVKGMGLEEAVAMIDKVEAAKHERTDAFQREPVSSRS